jgi:hypothetical protein
LDGFPVNQDFAFELTPAKARQLLKVSEICLNELDPAIEALARQDLLIFDGHCSQTPPEEKELAQFIADTGFRCGICSTTFDFRRENLLNMLAFLGVKELIITAQNLSFWNFLDRWKARMNIRIVKMKEMMSHEFQKQNRSCTVIFDWGTDSNEDNLEIVAKEFPKTMAYASRFDTGRAANRSFSSFMRTNDIASAPLVKLNYKSDTPQLETGLVASSRLELVRDNNFAWWEIGFGLNPNMPRAIFDLSTPTFKNQIMKEPVWKKSDVNDIAIMYNVFLPDRMQGYGFHR